jgi:hypothetical protein
VKRSLAQFLTAAADLSPEHVALLLAVGLIAGVFPICGVPTILCLLAACGLRLNPVTLQLVNHMSAPLQWALLLPLERVGARLCGDGGSAATQLLSLPMHAVTGWFCVCLPLGFPLYFVLLFLLRRRRTAWFNRLENPA